MTDGERANQLTQYTRERISTASQRILDALGRPDDISDYDARNGRTPFNLNAVVSIAHSEFTEIPEGAIPIITISKPLPEFAEEALFTYGIHYAVQSETGSKDVVLFKNGESAISSPADSRLKPRPPLLEDQGEKLANDLERIADLS